MPGETPERASGSGGGGIASNTTSKGARVVIVGAGPVGCLSALAFAKAGWEVEVYESRPDMRLPSSRAALGQRSVNLAISSRGLAALYAVDPAIMNKILDNVVPMQGRMLHTRDGKTKSQMYDLSGECINSIDRGLLNECLLEEALVCPAIRVFFRHKSLTADFDKRTMTFYSEEKKQNVNASFDLCVGADGSYSNVRKQMMRVVRMDYEQEYISHEYVELKMPAGTDMSGDTRFLLEPNYLHIWPRNSFMMIACPNQDKTFTCTLFAPKSDLQQLTSRAAASTWFRTNFSDAMDLIGEETLLNDFQQNPRNPLISLKAKPYHYKGRCIILGDAAHSMVPFYGQGLNCGLEDVRVLMNILRGEGMEQPDNGKLGEDLDDGLERALERYSGTRYDDLVAIRDMAADNYIELRHSVTTPGYFFRKRIDNLFAMLFGQYLPLSTLAPSLMKEPTGFPSSAPRGWLPLYTMVAFRPDISYAVAKKRAERQFAITTGVGWAVLGVGAWLGLAGVRALFGH